MPGSLPAQLNTKLSYVGQLGDTAGAIHRHRSLHCQSAQLLSRISFDHQITISSLHTSDSRLGFANLLVGEERVGVKCGGCGGEGRGRDDLLIDSWTHL